MLRQFVKRAAHALGEHFDIGAAVPVGHQAGHLLAAGPLLGEPGRAFRGLSILAADPDQARALKEQDPAVRAGAFRVECLPWLIPAGTVTFARTRFPRSMAEAAGD